MECFRLVVGSPLLVLHLSQLSHWLELVLVVASLPAQSIDQAPLVRTVFVVSCCHHVWAKCQRFLWIMQRFLACKKVYTHHEHIIQPLDFWNVKNVFKKINLLNIIQDTLLNGTQIGYRCRCGRCSWLEINDLRIHTIRCVCIYHLILNNVWCILCSSRGNNYFE